MCIFLNTNTVSLPCDRWWWLPSKPDVVPECSSFLNLNVIHPWLMQEGFDWEDKKTYLSVHIHYAQSLYIERITFSVVLAT